VWTRDLARGERVARLLRHGTVWINDFGPYLPSAEWSGFKRSGTGRELGPSGLHEYCEAKHVYRNHKPVVQNCSPARWSPRPDRFAQLGGTRTVALRTVPLSRPPPQ
jgi:hypothetical protein